MCLHSILDLSRCSFTLVEKCSASFYPLWLLAFSTAAAASASPAIPVEVCVSTAGESAHPAVLPLLYHLCVLVSPDVFQFLLHAILADVCEVCPLYFTDTVLQYTY